MVTLLYLSAAISAMDLMLWKARIRRLSCESLITDSYLYIYALLFRWFPEGVVQHTLAREGWVFADN